MKHLKQLILLLLIIFSLTGCYSSVSENPMNDVIPDDTVSQEVQPTEDTEEISSSEPEVPNGSSFEIHYIDVGQADAALVVCDGNYMLIDGGNPEDSSLIYSYLTKQNVEKLHTIVCSHAHDDHVGGLPAAVYNFKFENVYAPERENDIDAYNSFKNKVIEKGITIKNPKPGDSFDFGSSTVEFYGPVYDTTDLNNTSIVLKITYGETSFMFTGDAEREEEQDILNKNFDLSATVLKVGHHGGATSTTYPFLREVMPKYAVISVGKNNQYHHPTEDVLSRLRDADVTVYRTDLNGDIIAKSDGKNVTFTTKKNEQPTVVTQTPNNDNSQGSYIGNKKSKKFHYPTCHSLPAEHNQVIFSSREEAISQGFSSCGNCHP